VELNDYKNLMKGPKVVVVQVPIPCFLPLSLFIFKKSC